MYWLLDVRVICPLFSCIADRYLLLLIIILCTFKETFYFTYLFSFVTIINQKCVVL